MDVKEQHKQNVSKQMDAAHSPKDRLRAFLNGQVAAGHAILKKVQAVSDPAALKAQLTEELAFHEKSIDTIIAKVFDGK